MTTTPPSWRCACLLEGTQDAVLQRARGDAIPSIPTDNGAVSLCEAGSRAQAHGATLHCPPVESGSLRVEGRLATCW